jgi:hypothetical protein
VTVTAERLKELSTNENRQRVPLIEAVEEKKTRAKKTAAK